MNARLNDKLQIGTVEFAEPTLLIIGDEGSISWLAGTIETRRPLRFSDYPSFVDLANVDIILVPAEHEGGTKRSGNLLEWKVSAADATTFAEQLRVLASSSTPGHTYLDASSGLDVIQIMASKGEYPSSTLASNNS
jgi:hypothetical protein